MITFYENKEVEAEEFSDEEASSLSKVVTNIEGNVYAWKVGNDLSSEQAGALLSRYSRTSLSGRRLYLKEFLPNRDRGRDFFEAWLVDYGDDSIQEMSGGIPSSCEFISNLAVKELEDSRMGSYIEKSTRYVSFDKKLGNGDYMFYKDPKIMGSRFADEYLSLMRDLFDSYSKHTESMSKYIRDANPIENQRFVIGASSVKLSELNSAMEESLGVSEKDLQKAYENSVKANALDFMRDYLPMSILTNVGINMNARAYENTIIRLLSSPLYECNLIGQRLLGELRKMIPSLLKRVDDKHGLSQKEFLSSCRDNSERAVAGLTETVKPEDDSSLISLCDFTGMGDQDPNASAQSRVAAFIIYKSSRGFSLSQSKKIAESMTDKERDMIISNYVGERHNRRHKPGRAFESVNYTFDSCCRIGIYRDLHRHRIGTQERQRFTVKHGYNMRDQYRDIGISDDYAEKMGRVIRLYDSLAETMPYQAQYAVTFGFNIRWYYAFNARQMFHFAELRTGPGGHPDYRDLVQKMYLEVSKVHPSISRYMSYTDMSQKSLGRLSSEIRIAQKKNKLPGAK